MMYIDFKAGSKEYKLRLTTKSIVLLERQIGCNPLSIFGDGSTIPTVTTMVAILHASLQQYQHSVTLENAYNIFDNWLGDGHATTEFIPIIMDIYKASGIVPNDSEEEEVKND